MARVEDIKHDIEQLSEKEFIDLRQWFITKEWKKWDKQIEKDASEGKLDFLVKEARKEKAEKKLKVL